MYIPLLNTLKVLLQNEDLITEVNMYFAFSYIAFPWVDQSNPICSKGTNSKWRSGLNQNVTQIDKGHKSQALMDYCDGTNFSSHPLFSIHSSALQIVFYYDDLEVCNPLGSKAKIHKLSKFPHSTYVLHYTYLCFDNDAGIFYFTLGNMPPQQRSKLNSIYLVCLLKQKLLNRYGMDSVLQPFITDVKKLVN